MATRFIDGTGRTLGVEMKTWDGNHYSPDFSADFFEVGGLPYDKEQDASVVKDVAYIFDQAREWSNGEEEGVERDFIYTFTITPEKRHEIMRSARYTPQETKRYLANGQVSIYVKEEYEDLRKRFPEDYEGDSIEEVHYAECEDYIIVTNWV